MGPVSFESLDVGGERPEALRAASVLRDAGIRVMAVRPEPSIQHGGERFVVVVRSAEVARAREVLAALADADR
ncbi:MAG: hypothetical protein AAGD35_12445 [Actinomycetota bacterium]